MRKSLGVNLEHVIPLNPSAAWNHLDADTISANCKRIGNLALLKAGENVNAGNDDFATKKVIYAKSEFVLTADIAKAATWGPAEIQARQKKLTELAVKTWPLTV